MQNAQQNGAAFNSASIKWNGKEHLGLKLALRNVQHYLSSFAFKNPKKQQELLYSIEAMKPNQQFFLSPRLWRLTEARR